MIDIHSHLLFGVDDGSRTLEESVHVIKKLSEVGYTDIILTPHYINDSTYVSTREENLDVLKRLKVGLIRTKKFGAKSCIGCGCCSYVCPAKRYLVQSVKLAKKTIQERGI